MLPCNLLYYSVNGSQVFRSDPVSPPAPPLLAGDTATAADHLPVFLAFRNPSNVPMAIRGPTVITKSPPCVGKPFAASAIALKAR